MTSDRKIKANRANARASTGPKTRYGRTRSARNAFRHGLNVSVQADEVLCEEVQALAREIAGSYANARIQALAHLVAEAQIDLRRVRQLRHQFLSDKLSDPHYKIGFKRTHQNGSSSAKFAQSDGGFGHVVALETAGKRR